MNIRQTSQALLPARYQPSGAHYDIYPAWELPPGSIDGGFPALAKRIANHDRTVIDGFAGVMWEDFRQRLDQELQRLNIQVVWIDVAQAWRPADAIAAMVAPFLPDDDPLFGRRFTGCLEDFFDRQRLAAAAEAERGHAIFYGCGAALADPTAPLVYIDLPKNELQFRARAGLPTNCCVADAANAKAAYRRSPLSIGRCCMPTRQRSGRAFA